MQGSPPNEANLTHPEIVRDITREYLEAGASIILTNTFGANRFRLESHGLADKVREINIKAAEIAKQVVDGTGAIAGDIGPSGRLIALGEVTEEGLRAAFAEQAGALRDGGVDLDRRGDDVRRAGDGHCRASSERGDRLASGCQHDLQQDPEGFLNNDGDTPETCVRLAESAGASLVGANCGISALRMMFRSPRFCGGLRACRVDQGERRDSPTGRRKGHLPPHPGAVCGLCPSADRAGCGCDRGLLRNRSAVHQGSGQGDRARSRESVVAALFLVLCILFVFTRADITMRLSLRAWHGGPMDFMSAHQQRVAQLDSCWPGWSRASASRWTRRG